MTQPDLLNPVDTVDEDGDGTTALRRRLAALRSVPNLAMWIGVVISAVGFLFIAIGWNNTAGESDVAFQTPYIMSGGLFGAGLVVLGALTISVSSRASDHAERRRQLQELAETLHELHLERRRQ